MATTVLSGTSGALYYKPAGTSSTFAPAGVNIATDTITVPTYLGYRVGDPVQFSLINTTTNGAGTGTLPAGLSTGTTYYVISYAASTGAMQVSATEGGSAVDLTDVGTAASPNKFQVAYDAFVVVGQVREWSFEMSRAEIDVTTIGQGNQQYVPFRTFIAGFGEGSGSATFYFTNEDANMGNRIIEDVLQRQQTGAAFKLYIDRVFTGGVVDDTLSRSVAFDAILTSANLAINPDDAQSVSVNFRPAVAPVFDFTVTA